MKRPAPMDFASTPSTPSSAHVPMPMPMPTTQPPAPTQAPVPVSASFSITPPSASSSTSPSSSSLSSSSSSPDLGQHSPARQRLRLDSSSDTPPGALNTLPVSHPDTSLTMATADTSQLPISSFDPPTPLLASVSLPATVSSSSSLVSSTPNSFLTLTPSTLAASSTSRSPTPTLLSIQQALGNPSPSDPSTASQGVDPDETPRLTSPATLRAANLRAEGMMASPASSAALASAPASSVPTLPPAWAMPSGATIQQHLAHQLHQAQQQLGGAAAHVPGSSSSDIDEDDGDDQDQGALGRSSSLGEMSTDDRMHVDETRARGMAVNRAEPAFMTTLAQRHHQQQHAYHEETGGYTSGSSSSDEDEDDQDAAGHNELTAVVAAAADAMSASSAPATSGAGTGTGTGGVRQRTISTRKRTTSSTSTTASSAAKQRHDDLPHGHLDPISGTPVDLPHPDDDDWDHDTIDFMASVPPLSPMYQRRAPLLPPISAGKTHTLVLDLDETLLHCTTVPMADCGLSFSVDFNGVRFDIYGNLRPGVRRFLRKVAKVFEVVIFTASQQVYAERVLKVLDPRAEYISHVLHRDHCVPILGNYLKDLSVLGRDLRRTLIVDNAPQAFAYHPANGLPIRSWYDDPSDRALRRLGRRLVALAHLDDVRPAVRAMSHVHARLEGVARQSGRVPVGLAMAFSNHDTDDAGKVSPGAGAQDDSMDVDSWGSSGSSSAASNAAHEMMMMAGGGVPGFGFATPNIKQYSLSADAYPQLWQPAVLPPTVQVKLGLASAPVSVSAHMGMTQQQQQQQQALTDLISSPIPSTAPTALMSVHQPDGSVAVVDRSVPMDEDVDLDLADDACADAEVARVTGNYSPSPLLAPASLSSSPYVGASARASLNATPLAERRGNGSPEPLRLTPVQQQTGAAPAPKSTLTTPATTSNSTSAAVSTYAVTPSSPANANMNMASMMMVMPSKAAANETPLPTPVTPTFDAHKDAGAVEDRMDVVTSSAAADGNGAAQRQGPQQQQQQVASAEEAGLMAAMAVSE